MTYLQVKVLAPKETLFEGEALSVSSKNSSGRFDILPEHANFITLIENNSLIIAKKNKEKLQFNFSLAIIYVSRNQVNIYTDIALPL